MRKQFKMLLLVAMILTLFVMAMLVSSASEAAPFVALNGETVVSEHPNFKAAFAVVKAGEADTIRLDADVTMNEAIEVDANVTIDGNGHTMTFSSTVRSGYLFNFKKEGMVATVKNLTLEDSMLKPTSNRVSGLFFMHEDSVTLTVKNVIAEGHTGDIANCAKIEGVKCVSGTTITIDGCVMISDTSTISIQFSSNEIPDANGDKITKKNTVVIKNSTLEAQQTGTTGFTYLVNCDVVIESSAIKTGSMVFRIDKAQEPNTYKVVGDTRIEADMFAYTRGCGFEVVVGSPDDGPQPQIHVNTYLERWDQTTPGKWTVYGGTFTSETYFFRNGGKAANVLNIYGGTFIANNGQPIVRTEAVTVTPVVNIYGGEFHLSNGSQISVNTKNAAAPLGITLPATLPSGEAVAPGSVKVFLGNDAANDATTQKFFIDNGWAAAGAHFTITAWDVDTSNMYEFTENFTGTFAEWKEKVGAVVYQAPITAYEALRAKDSTDQIFFANQNLFVDIGVMPPFVIRDPEVTVTINGGSYDVNGLFAVVEGGNLVFTNCEINATTTLVELTGGKVTVENVTIVATGSNPLIVVNGENAAVDLKGANTSITAENAIV
ncbi:MAG: hypothetical protein IKB41_05220, partial [Clostridia bacterium]|nr:hypothetical protein [Clostridia bacterium]